MSKTLQSIDEKCEKIRRLLNPEKSKREVKVLKMKNLSEFVVNPSPRIKHSTG